jgi:catechol 2,3-dioxygenase-like lactoylglutathione lyase family enzyme
MVLMGIETASVDTMASFYSDVLELKLRKRDEDSALFDCGGVTLEIRRGRSAEKQELRFETGDIEAEVRGLKSRGARLEVFQIGLKPGGDAVVSEIAETFWGRFASLQDPDGNRIVVSEHDREWFPYFPSWYGREDNRQTNG